jgi:hypothetical protein
MKIDYRLGMHLSTLMDYYVTIDSVEPIENNKFLIVFHCITRHNYKEVSSKNIREAFELVIPHLISLSVDDEFLKNFFPIIRSRNFIGKWFVLITTNDPTSLSGNVSEENREFPEYSQVYIDSIELINQRGEIVKQLNNFFSARHLGYSNRKKIEKHLKSINLEDGTFHKLNVYNVGQGSLSAVTDQMNKPLFYFDLGGAWWMFPRSYPTTLKLCFEKTKTVILSHWDLDHVETARRLFYSNPILLDGITWIAPKQFLSPIYARLAARMFATGRLIFWSVNSVLDIRFWAGRLIKCSGPAKNHNGIALLVQSPNNSIKNVLHPGDASYRYIPGLSNFELDGLVATHHGANFDFNNMPVSVSIIENGAIAYSHDNKYGHPTAASVDAHEAANWINRRDTTSQSISFTLGLPISTSTCNGTNCNLIVTQSF